jgi:hypothetical protein
MRQTTDGINVSGVVKYRINDPHYKEVLDHLGGVRPGDTKLVPAWGSGSADEINPVRQAR